MMFEGLHLLAEAFSNTSAPAVQHGELRCDKWCYRFQCSGRDVSCERRAAVWDPAASVWKQPQAFALPSSV